MCKEGGLFPLQMRRRRVGGLYGYLRSIMDYVVILKYCNVVITMIFYLGKAKRKFKLQKSKEMHFEKALLHMVVTRSKEFEKENKSKSICCSNLMSSTHSSHSKVVLDVCTTRVGI